MIFIKHGDSFERANDWTEIQNRENYRPKLDLQDQQLSDVFGYYEDLPEEIPCGKASCRAGHKKGFLVITEDGLETNLGHVCGTNVFGIAFENLAIDLEKKPTITGTLQLSKRLRKTYSSTTRPKQNLNLANHHWSGLLIKLWT